MKLPNKFEFKVEGTGRDYQMTFMDGVYFCTNVGQKAEKYHAMHSVKSVKDCIKSGTYIITKDLDEPKEPELVFPFVVQTSYDNTYKVDKDSKGVISMTGEDGRSYDRSEDQVRSFIKCGAWIIKSVGEQLSDTERMVKTLGSEPSEENKAFYNSLTAKKAPTSVTEILKLCVDSSQVKEATEAFKELAQRIENVNIALESMQQLMSEIGLAKDSAIVEPVQDYSGFNLEAYFKGK